MFGLILLRKKSAPISAPISAAISDTISAPISAPLSEISAPFRLQLLPQLPAAPLPTSHAPRRAARPSPRLPLPTSTGRAACLDRRENTWICKVSREMPDLSCKAGIVDLQGTFRKVRAVCLRTSRFQFSIHFFYKNVTKIRKFRLQYPVRWFSVTNVI